MKKDLTISEIADKLEVTKQCIYHKLKNLNELKLHVYKKGGIRYITNKGFEIINDSLNSDNVDSEKEFIQEDKFKYFNDLKVMYEERIKDLKNENENRIKDLKDEIENLRDESRQKNELIFSIQKESEKKNKLLENMQILIKEKDDKILLEKNKKKKKWWLFNK